MKPRSYDARSTIDPYRVNYLEQDERVVMYSGGSPVIYGLPGPLIRFGDYPNIVAEFRNPPCEYCGRRREAGFAVCQGCGAPV